MFALLPGLSPLPRRFWLVLVALVVSAWLLLVPANIGPGTFPGDVQLPYAPVTLNLHWQAHTRGIAGVLADDLHGLPYRTDRSVVDGIPVDALASWPFCAVFGFAGGMWLYALTLIWALGAAAAWLGGRWWGTWSGALAAGVGFQVCEGVLREIGEGRSTVAFASIFLPLTLGLGVLAAEGGAGAAVLAGVCAAVATLASWDFALLAVPLAIGPALLRRDAASGLSVLAAYAVLVLPAAAWVWSGLPELPSAGLDPWAPARLGGALVRPADLAAGRIYGMDGVALGTVVRPVLVALAAYGAWTRRREGGALQRWAWPLAVVSGAVLLGVGAWLPGPVVMPWGWLSMVPAASRLWWADRAWILAGLVLALAAGSVRLPTMVSLLAGGLLVEEAALLSRAVPFGAVGLLTPDSALRLAVAPDVPLLLLPLGQGRFRGDRLDLIEQISHGRPMADGTRSPFDATAPHALARAWRENAGLHAVGQCEQGLSVGTAVVDAATTRALVHAGIREVWLDLRYVGEDAAGAAYRRCVEVVLDGWTPEPSDPFVRYRAP